MWTVEFRGEVDLGQEPLSAQHRGQLRPQHLEGHIAVVLEVVGEVDRGHPALAQLAVKAVAIGEGGLQSDERVWQLGRQEWSAPR